MKPKFLAVIAALALADVSQASANTIYAVHDGIPDLNVDCSIITDGNLGVLGSADIVAWNLTVSSPSQQFLTLNTGNGGVQVQGSNLTATSTTLLWNYFGDFGFLRFNGSSGLPFPFGGTVLVDWEFGDFGITCGDTCDPPPLSQLRSGIGVVGTNPTPLPAALPLFATGLGALGLLGWRRKRKAAPH